MLLIATKRFNKNQQNSEAEKNKHKHYLSDLAKFKTNALVLMVGNCQAPNTSLTELITVL